jgi:hypothetical protein
LKKWQTDQRIRVESREQITTQRWGTTLNIIKTTAPLSIITLARSSKYFPEGGYACMMAGNLIITAKFVEDFINPRQVEDGHESVAWHDTRAVAAFPEVHPSTGALPLSADDTNQHCNARFIEFFDHRRDNSEVIMLIRGIDGGRIEFGTWARLHARYPKLKIKIVFTLAHEFAIARAPAHADASWFAQTTPFDGRLYCCFELDLLVAQINGQLNDPRYQWLLDEWL